MKFLIILGFILTINITFAQGRKDTLRMKDGNEILCQILNISRPDSVIQFCIRENGELTVKKVHTSFVDSYSWPGRNKAVKYSRMLNVKNIQSGTAYNGYWLTKQHAATYTITGTDPVALEIKKAKTLGAISFAVIGAGLVTAIVIPNLRKSPTVQANFPGGYFSKFDDYVKTNKVYRQVGYSITAAGVLAGLLSLNHLTLADNLKKEAGNGISLSVTGNGVSLAFNF